MPLRIDRALVAAHLSEALQRLNEGGGQARDAVLVALFHEAEQLRKVLSLRPEVIAFAIAMEHRLQEKDQDKVATWKHKGPKDLAVDLVSKCMALDQVCRVLPASKVDHIAPLAYAKLLKHAVDAGNIAMFIADVAGVLDLDYVRDLHLREFSAATLSAAHHSV